ncbi:unnamed protein product, partial [Sphacelaria rigidula]
RRVWRIIKGGGGTAVVTVYFVENNKITAERQTPAHRKRSRQTVHSSSSLPTSVWFPRFYYFIASSSKGKRGGRAAGADIESVSSGGSDHKLIYPIRALGKKLGYLTLRRCLRVRLYTT